MATSEANDGNLYAGNRKGRRRPGKAKRKRRPDHLPPYSGVESTSDGVSGPRSAALALARSGPASAGFGAAAGARNALLFHAARQPVRATPEGASDPGDDDDLSEK